MAVLKSLFAAAAITAASSIFIPVSYHSFEQRLTNFQSLERVACEISRAACDISRAACDINRVACDAPSVPYTAGPRIGESQIVNPIDLIEDEHKDEAIDSLPSWTLQYFEDKPYFDCYYTRGGEGPNGIRHMLHQTLLGEEGYRMLKYYLDAVNHRHMVVVCKLGKTVCGHEGIIHGGFTASLVDNALGGLAGVVLQNSVATKSLTVNYKAPIKAEDTIVLTTEIVSVTPEKKYCTLRATVRGINNKIYAECEAVFADVSQKWKAHKPPEI